MVMPSDFDDEAVEKATRRHASRLAWAVFWSQVWRWVMGAAKLVVLGLCALILVGLVVLAAVTEERSRREPCYALGGHYEPGGLLGTQRCWADDGTRLWPKEWR